MGQLLGLGEEARQFIWLVGIVMARLTPIFQIVPFLGGKHLTALTRGSLSFSLAMFLVPWISRHAPPTPLAFFGILPLLAKEVALGTVFGFLSSLAFNAASGVGFLVDNQRGLSMAQVYDPLSNEETSPLGSLSIETLIIIFIATGGLALFFQAILATYAFWSPFSFWPNWASTPLRKLVLDQFGWYVMTMVALSAPMLLVCFLVDLGMGLMNRFAPQMNVFFLAMPIKSALVMALMVVYWTGMMRILNRDVLRLPVLWDALRHVFSIV